MYFVQQRSLPMMTNERFEQIRAKVEAAKAKAVRKLREEQKQDSFTTRSSADEVIEAARALNEQK